MSLSHRRAKTDRVSSVETPPSIEQARKHATASGLIYVSDADPGIARLKRGKGFSYQGPDARRITSATTLNRIRQLAIPPAYTDVWICRNERGHLQATGRDARRRKQYRYHARWRETRDDGKFARMIEFGAQLPKLRHQLKRDQKLPGMPMAKVLAVIVSLLDETLIRVGNEEYARSNKSYGLTTLRDRHVRFLRDGRAVFSFRGKSGQAQEIALDDKHLSRLIRRLQQIPGQQLFQYFDDAGKRQPVDSGMVNDYLRRAMCDGSRAGPGEGFTAKDFRTWGATVRAIAFLAGRPCGDAPSARALSRCINETAKSVASSLGNTPAVCRKSYINPVVFEAWQRGSIHHLVPHASVSPRRMEKISLAVLRAAAR